MSFVGYFEDLSGNVVSQDRIFATSGDSLNMTRSLGDRSAARSIIATPSFSDAIVPDGSCARMVICSDGVWDNLTTDEVVKLARPREDIVECAHLLSEFATRTSNQAMKVLDDITVIVVDIGGSQIYNQKPMTACCAIQ